MAILLSLRNYVKIWQFSNSVDNYIFHASFCVLSFQVFFFRHFRDVSVGDVATVGECRPLSKTVKFNTLKVTRGAGTKNKFKKF